MGPIESQLSAAFERFSLRGVESTKAIALVYSAAETVMGHPSALYDVDQAGQMPRVFRLAIGAAGKLGI